MAVDLVADEGRMIRDRFEHLAQQFSRCPLGPDSGDYFRRTMLELDKALLEAHELRRLPDAILDVIDVALAPLPELPFSRPKKRTLRMPGWPKVVQFVVGYASCENKSTEIAENFFAEVLVIEPGAIRDVWPGIFRTIDASIGPFQTIGDPDELLLERMFEVTGYYAAACKAIANWINPAEEHPKIVDSTVAQVHDNDVDFITAAVELSATNGKCVPSKDIAAHAFGRGEKFSRRMVDRLKSQGLIVAFRGGGLTVTDAGCKWLSERTAAS